MENHRLLLLGLLKAQAQHGYQMMDFIDRNLGQVTNLKKATAYYELKRLQELGLITSRQEQEVGRPPRQVYSLTPQGEATFLRLLRQTLSQVGPETASADIGLMFINRLPAGEVHDLLGARLHALQERLQAYGATPSHGEGSGVNLAVQLASARLETEIRWFEGLIRSLERPDRHPRAARKPEVTTH